VTALFDKRQVELLVDFGNGCSLDGRQLVSDSEYGNRWMAHMIYQLLSTILDLIIGMKQVDMLLDDLFWILTSTSLAILPFHSMTKVNYPSCDRRSAISSCSLTILGSVCVSVIA
jgi:hypothetical protein